MTGRANYDVEVAVGLLTASGLAIVILAAVVVVEVIKQWRRSR